MVVDFASIPGLNLLSSQPSWHLYTREPIKLVGTFERRWLDGDRITDGAVQQASKDRLDDRGESGSTNYVRNNDSKRWESEKWHAKPGTQRAVKQGAQPKGLFMDKP